MDEKEFLCYLQSPLCFCRIVQFKRNPEYNFKVMSEIDHNKKHTEIDSVLWFGPDFKDATKRMDYGFEMNRNWPKNSVDFNTRFKFPYMVRHIFFLFFFCKCCPKYTCIDKDR